MTVAGLSTSAQNYIKAMWSAGEWSKEPITASVIATRTGVRTSTVSDAVRKLSEQGLVIFEPYGEVELTDKGRELALAMVRRHRLIETFLVTVLGYSWDEVHDEAEELEHAVSDLMIDRIDQVLNFPTRDPHGDPIPAADGTMIRPPAVQLSLITPPATVSVARIWDGDAGQLTYFASCGIVVDAELKLKPGAPFSGTIEVETPTASLQLGSEAAESIWVIPDGDTNV